VNLVVNVVCNTPRFLRKHELLILLFAGLSNVHVLH